MDGTPGTSPADTQSALDRDELNLLARLHIALGALTGLLSLFCALPIWEGAVAMRQLSSGELDQYLVSVVLLAMGISLAVLCLVHVGVLLYIARLIRTCRRWWLVMIFSSLHLINIPFGTALSIYTFVVLGRDTVRRRFRAGGRYQTEKA
ncbi:MAG TPA: hypothetical protein VHC22_08735 [Pirellulales bacterium]|nr:hypothetical protein [Pirellulales bacterium]